MLKRRNLIILGAKGSSTESKKPLPFKKDEWLCFENLSSNIMTIKMNTIVLNNCLVYYSYDNVDYDLFGGTAIIPPQSKIYFYWENYIEKNKDAWVWECSQNYKVSGELKYADKTNYGYYFTLEKTLINASGLKLSATTLSDSCYKYMFNGCTSLTTAPALPATELANSCYEYMFNDCSSLTQAPALPATELANSCYEYMFNGCSSLTTAPALPATELANSCYKYMFNGCSSLTTAPALPATELANSCYRYMFNGCTSLTTAPALPATELANSCYRYMFNGCTSLTTAPALPATELASICYESMFKGCTSLTTAPVLPATELATSCYNSMFNGCSSLNYVRTFVNEWNVTNTYNWLSGVASEGIIETNSKNIPTNSTNGVPNGWTVKRLTVDVGLIITNLSEYENVITINNGAKPFSYRVDDGEWVDVVMKPYSIDIRIQNKVAIDGYYADSAYGRISAIGNFALSGNLTNTDKTSAYYSLFKDNEKLIYTHDLIIGDEKTNISESACYSMFEGCVNLQTAPKIFSRNILRNGCHSMFKGCTSLVQAPELPCTNLIEYPYQSMFEGCVNLQSAPALPAKRGATSCYQSMFKGCSNLQTAPEICLTELGYNYMNEMFYGCSKLNKVKIHVTDWKTSYADRWLSGVASEGIIETNSVNIPTNSTSGVPNGWTKKGFAVDNTLILTNESENENTFTLSNTLGVYQYKINEGDWQEVEELTSHSITIQSGETLTLYGILNHVDSESTLISATNNFSVSGNLNVVIAKGFKGLFLNNDKLINAEGLQLSRTVREYCYNSMFKGCSNLQTAPIFSVTDLYVGCYESMFEGCSNLVSIPNIPIGYATRDFCFKNMFKNCISLTEGMKVLHKSVAPSCYESMFEGCVNLQSAPVLPATELTSNCYNSMFKGCTSLVQAEVDAIISSFQSCNSMFEGCTSLNYVKVGIEHWNSANMNNWLLNVSESGLLVNTSSNLVFNSPSGVPIGWNVETFVNNKIIIKPTSTWIQVDIADSCTNYSYKINEGEIIKVPELTSQSIRVEANQTLTIYGIGNNKGEEGQTMIKTDFWFEVECEFNEVYDYSYYRLFGENTNSKYLNVVKMTVNTNKMASHCFDGMFNGCINLSAINTDMFENVTTLAPYCFASMFANTIITESPDLSNIYELAEHCYDAMFHSSQLQKTPTLPATELKEHCYDAMFVHTDITSITLPAEVVPEGAYSWLLAYSQINEITLKCIDAISTFNTQQWLEGVPEGGTIYLNPDASWGETIERGVTTIPESWNVAYYE